MALLSDDFVTADLAEAESYITRNYGNVDLTADRLTFAENSIGDDRFALRSLAVDGGYTADCALEAVIVVQSAQGYQWEVDGVRGDAVAPVLFQPGSTLACRLEDTRVRVTALPLPALTDLARTVYNDDTLEVRFDGHSIVDAAMARAWESVSTMAFQNAGALGSDLLAATVFRSVAVTALEAFALVGDRAERVVSVQQQQRAYRAGLAFIEDHASLPITVDDAAAAAGVSSATLNRAFRSHSLAARTPAQHLLAARLDAAHGDLVRTDLESGDSLAQIAARWGFTERSLTRAHVEVYGVRPQDLLGR